MFNIILIVFGWEEEADHTLDRHFDLISTHFLWMTLFHKELIIWHTIPYNYNGIIIFWAIKISL